MINRQIAGFGIHPALIAVIPFFYRQFLKRLKEILA
jgi:hypothetical protein